MVKGEVAYKTDNLRLSVSGTVLGSSNPDAQEQNDLFATAAPITTAHSLEGFFDTANDDDYFTFFVGTSGSLNATLAHPTLRSWLYLYDGTQQQITYTSDAAHTLTRSLSPGTYYLRVVPRDRANKDVGYMSLSFE